MKQERDSVMDKLGGEVNLHKKNRNELNEQINESMKQLKDLKQRNQMSTIQSQASTGDKVDKNGASADQEFNIDDLLNDLRRDITRVYKKAFDGDVELQAK
jgi:ribosomal protein L29